MKTQTMLYASQNRMFSKNDQDLLRFFQVPKNLYENKIYKEVSNGAKMMYSILRDRQYLSIANNWLDDDGYVYFFYDGDELSEYMNVSRTTIQKYKKELVKNGLMFQNRQGQGKPNKMYILKPESVDNTLMNRNCTSKGTETVQLGVQKMHTNDTEVKETENKDTKYIHLSPKDGVFLSLYLSCFYNKFNNEHMRIKEDDYYRVIDGLSEVEEFMDEEDYMDIIKEHFQTMSTSNNGNILAFIEAKDRFIK